MKLEQAVELTCVATCMLGIALGLQALLAPGSEYYEAHAIDKAGHAYHVGNGRNCAEAFNSGELPTEWVHLVCKVVR